VGDVRRKTCNRVDGEPHNAQRAEMQQLRPTSTGTCGTGEGRELVLTVVRDGDVGLGMSVTGGVGTTAYRHGDEVCLCVLFICSSVCRSVCLSVVPDRGVGLYPSSSSSLLSCFDRTTSV